MKHILTTILLLGISVCSFSWIETEGKFFTFNRNGNNNAFMYQDGNNISASSLNNTKPCWWILEPTQNADCYYIKNATTGNYIQSAKRTLSSLVTMGTTPVEFKIVKDETSGASTKGFYYFASTDQTISNATDGTLGLNYGSNGIVVYYIKSGRGNSYWTITESSYDYAAPEVKATEYSKKIGIYSIPCGNATDAHVATLSVKGHNVSNEINYSSGKPSNYHTIYTLQKAIVGKGSVFGLSCTITNADENYNSYLYFDWNNDGVFDQSIDCNSHTTINKSILVPDTATTGKSRMRLRLTSTATSGAEDDVIGGVYDFIINIADNITSERSLSVEPNDSTRGTVCIEGQDSTNLTATYGTKVTVSATSKGNSTFKHWLLNNVIASTEATYTFNMNQDATLIGVFTPNTEDETTSINTITNYSAKKSDKAYNLQGQPIGNTYKGIKIINGKKTITKHEK